MIILKNSIDFDAVSHLTLIPKGGVTMELQTISEVSKSFQISTRTLRYYEQIGLLKSCKKEDYAYRTYDDRAITRLQQVIVLRKLRIPLKHIIVLLDNDNTTEMIRVLNEQLTEVNEEITVLSTIRSILDIFLERLKKITSLELKQTLLDDISILDIVESLSVSKTTLKEEKSMNEFNLENAKPRKLTDKEVRITYLPPMTVAALHSMGSTAEQKGAAPIKEFIERNELVKRFPQMRHLGFNHPNGVKPDGSDHGYERWITIPEDLEVAAPFVKKHFDGGLYATHMIPMGAFEEWELLYNWGVSSDKYDIAAGDPECMYGSLEEHLNFINMYDLEGDDSSMQLDLLLPIRMKEINK